MKLRIKDNSLRFRLLRSEVEALAASGRIEAYTLLGLTNQADRISYAVEHDDRYQMIGAARVGDEIRVTVPTREVLEWAQGEAIGLYGEQPVYGTQTLTIVIEKDFACIDRDDADNSDTFENPNAVAC